MLAQTPSRDRPRGRRLLAARFAIWLSFPLLASCDPDKPIVLPDPVPEDYDAAWSADGQWLAFQHTDPGSAPSVMIARLDGTQRQVVVPNAGMPDWSPDGLALTFVQNQRIGKIVLATGTITWLSPAGAFSLGPAWSPNGATIAFSTNNGVNTNPPDLWTVASSGGTPVRVGLSGPPRSQTDDVDWSPDSQHLVATVAGQEARLFVTTVGASDTTAFPSLGGDATQPAWSPLGNRIAYARLAGRADVWLVSPDGSGNRLLVADAIRPTWSPDGSRVAFSRRSLTDMSIWSVDTLGGNLTRVSWAVGHP